LFSGLRENVKEQFKKIGIIPALVPESQCFENFEKATLWLTENLENKGSKEVNELLATKQTN